MKFWISALILLLTLHNSMGGVKLNIHFYKNYPNRGNSREHDIPAELDTSSTPATITLKKGTDAAVNIASVTTLLKESVALKPSNVPSSSYVFFWVSVNDVPVRVTDVDTIDYADNSICIRFNMSTEFMPEGATHMLDFGNGGALLAVNISENSNSRVISLHKRHACNLPYDDLATYNGVNIYLGGPCFQVVKSRLLTWTALCISEANCEGDKILFTVQNSARNKFWIQRMRDETIKQHKTIHPGCLERDSNGKWEFVMRFEDDKTASSIETEIRNIVTDSSNSVPNSMRYNSGLCLLATETRPKDAKTLLVRKIFGVTAVNKLKNDVVICFASMENEDGRPTMHVLKCKIGHEEVSLDAFISFDEDKYSGVAVVEKCFKSTYFLTLCKIDLDSKLQTKIDSGTFTIQASGALAVDEVKLKLNTSYNWPLILNPTSIGPVGDLSFEIHFSAKE